MNSLKPIKYDPKSGASRSQHTEVETLVLMVISLFSAPAPSFLPVASQFDSTKVIVLSYYPRLRSKLLAAAREIYSIVSDADPSPDVEVAKAKFESYFRWLKQFGVVGEDSTP